MVLVNDKASTMVDAVAEIFCEISSGQAHGEGLVQKPKSRTIKDMKIDFVFVFIRTAKTLGKYIFAEVGAKDQPT